MLKLSKKMAKKSNNKKRAEKPTLDQPLTVVQGAQVRLVSDFY